MGYKLTFVQGLRDRLLFRSGLESALNCSVVGQSTGRLSSRDSNPVDHRSSHQRRDRHGSDERIGVQSDHGG